MGELTERPLLILGLQDEKFVKEFESQVKYLHYSCVHALSLEEVIKLTNSAIKTGIKTGTLILDTAYLQAATADHIALLQTLANTFPIIFVSQDNDVTTRLKAVQAGGKAYLTYPLSFSALIEKIEQIIIQPNEKMPYRILIIEDSPTQALGLSKSLIQAGMITEILQNPIKLNDVLIEFQPDLILLDLHMPFCSGMDLAQVIRQQDTFSSIPIVFISIEEDLHKQLNAMEQGGIAFLKKPICPTTFIRTVTTHVERYRSLHAEMIQDSLTGLLNHSRILEQLDLEIARARRNHTALSFAMLDLDYFKNINDTYGHPAGDSVIKALAHILKQRLRKSDSIGRYGGEEFAIILPQTDCHTVYPILDDIRQNFAKITHHTGTSALIEFSGTFSVGLAQYDETHTNTVDKLVYAADQALYIAKEKGRNQIVIRPQLPC